MFSLSNKQKLISGSRRLTALALAAVLLFGCLFAAVPAEAKDKSDYSSSYSAVASSSTDIHKIFPRSYWSGLDALLKAHPNWRFQAFYTGLDWNECFDGSYWSGESEMYYSRNLLEGHPPTVDDNGKITYNNDLFRHPSSWYETDELESYNFSTNKREAHATFNWASNSWVVLSAPNWIQASEDAIRYCMDPRNFFSDEMIFQFEDMLIGKNTYHPSVADVEAIFNNVEDGDGIPGNFWTRSAEETSIVSELAGSKGKKMTYAEAIYAIGEEIGVSPVFIASRIVQEQGLGTSPLISGKKSFTVIKTMTKEEAEKLKKEEEEKKKKEEGETSKETEKESATEKGSSGETESTEPEYVDVEVTIPGGYYNYFNIEATDGGKEDYELIYTNGLREAYNAPAKYYGPWNTRFRALIGGALKTKEMYFTERASAADPAKLSALRQSTVYFQKFCVDSTSQRCMWGQYMGSLTTPQLESQKAYKSYTKNGKVNSTHLFIIPVYENMPGSPAARPTKDGNPNYKIGSIYVSYKEMSKDKKTSSDTKAASIEKFGADTFEYEWEVDYEDYEVTLYISPYAKDTSKILVNGKQIWPAEDEKVTSIKYSTALQIGENKFDVKCIAENGDSKVYSVVIRRNGEIVYGDINSDGKFNSLDLAYMTSHLLGKNKLTGSALEAADISGDGKVNSLDLAYLTSYLLGKIKKMPR